MEICAIQATDSINKSEPMNIPANCSTIAANWGVSKFFCNSRSADWSLGGGSWHAVGKLDGEPV
jgi:hypothetical protein